MEKLSTFDMEISHKNTFDMEISHKKGNDNVVVDTLSRKIVDITTCKILVEI